MDLLMGCFQVLGDPILGINALNKIRIRVVTLRERMGCGLTINFIIELAIN